MLSLLRVQARSAPSDAFSSSANGVQLQPTTAGAQVGAAGAQGAGAASIGPQVAQEPQETST